MEAIYKLSKSKTPTQQASDKSKGILEEESNHKKNPNPDPIEKWRGVIKGKKTTDEIVAKLRGYGIEGKKCLMFYAVLH